MGIDTLGGSFDLNWIVDQLTIVQNVASYLRVAVHMNSHRRRVCVISTRTVRRTQKSTGITSSVQRTRINRAQRVSKLRTFSATGHCQKYFSLGPSHGSE